MIFFAFCRFFHHQSNLVTGLSQILDSLSQAYSQIFCSLGWVYWLLFGYRTDLKECFFCLNWANKYIIWCWHKPLPQRSDKFFMLIADWTILCMVWRARVPHPLLISQLIKADLLRWECDLDFPKFLYRTQNTFHGRHKEHKILEDWKCCRHLQNLILWLSRICQSVSLHSARKTAQAILGLDWPVMMRKIVPFLEVTLHSP